jgi:hypothetical protein
LSAARHEVGDEIVQLDPGEIVDAVIARGLAPQARQPVEFDEIARRQIAMEADQGDALAAAQFNVEHGRLP